MENKKKAGRPLLYGESTEVVSTHVPKSRKKEFKAMVEKWLKQFKVDEKV